MSPEGATISNQAPEGVIFTMVVVTWSEKVEGSGGKIDYLLCGLLYKEEDGYIFPWSGIDLDSKTNFST